MKNFSDFLVYKSDHISEVQYDTIAPMKDEWNAGLTLSQADIELITKISTHTCVALLRQYHNWLYSDE